MTTTQDERYRLADEESKKLIEAIVTSTSLKKVVVAGPGTGKTYLFRKIVEGKTNTLTLTFINALVEDLSLELYGTSDVKTLHSFARSQLGKVVKGVKVYPKLSGYSDIIFALAKYLEREKEKIPAYDQVLVDEFQDFNKLEISLIDLLSEKSQILLVGDDDQALYDDLKSASAEHIRERFGDSETEYQPFGLPHCRRCTRVIVDAVNDVVSNAKDKGVVQGRIDKRYEYFEEREKDLESENNPKIIYSR
ncbi:MAG: AAA family ATPase, partial [Bacteroidota bacterium]